MYRNCVLVNAARRDHILRSARNPARRQHWSHLSIAEPKVSQITKHIDVRWHFICELRDEGKLKDSSSDQRTTKQTVERSMSHLSFKSSSDQAFNMDNYARHSWKRIVKEVATKSVLICSSEGECPELGSHVYKNE
jgi:hypothetical protein